MPSPLHLGHTHIVPPTPALRRILNRHTRSDLLSLVDGWLRDPRLRPGTRHGGAWTDYVHESSKKRIIDSILRRDWPYGLNLLQIAQLDMLYHQQHSKLSSWRTWRLVWDHDYDVLPVSNDLLLPPLIEKKLSEALGEYYKTHVYAMEHTSSSSVWVRISVFDGLSTGALPSNSNVLYLVWLPHSEYMFSSGTLKSYKDFIAQSLSQVFGADGLEEHPLQGKQILSLSQLLLSRFSQGPTSSYRLNKTDANPLDFHQKHKPIVNKPKYLEVHRGPGGLITCDHDTAIHARDEQVQDKYGWETMEGFERLDIEHIGSLHAFPNASSPMPNVRMHLSFEGTNVQEGIRALVAVGFASPLPDWLVDATTIGNSNKVVFHASETMDHPIPPHKLIQETEPRTSRVTGIELLGWTITSRKCPILNAGEIEQAQQTLSISLPEMIFGNNYLLLSHADGFEMVFRSLDALKRVDKTSSSSEHIKVAYSDEWTKKNKSTHGHIVDVVKPYDWTYSTDYAGTVDHAYNDHTFELTRQGIDIEKLKIQEPILYYDENILYEDELADNGTAILLVKLRVMPSGFFLLQRFFLRVDDVLFRVNDTRIHHEFGKDWLTREYMSREDHYENVKRQLPLNNGRPDYSPLTDANWVAAALPPPKKENVITERIIVRAAS